MTSTHTTTSAADSQPETHGFRAEVSALLRLVTNSLYTNSEVFLRELVSNAADALDKARYLGLVEADLLGKELEPSIEIIVDAKRGILTIQDNGVGLTKEEASENLGTIAHSGTLAFLDRAREAGKGEVNLIGQFGVGFYSAFMVATRVEVTSLSARPNNQAIIWSSAGDGTYVLAVGEKSERGTSIELHLRDESREFLSRWRVEEVIRKYSNYVVHPIRLTVIDEDGQTTLEPTQVNAAKPLWAKAAAEVTDEEISEFYRHVMGGFLLPGDRPLVRLQTAAEAPVQFTSLLFVPSKAPTDLFAEDRKALQLYARRVLVLDNTEKLLPRWLRFFRGVVDSEDLPLNVSREMLQEHRSVAAIRRTLTRKALKALSECASERPDDYTKLWNEFGAVIKEGLHDDSSYQAELLEIVRFCTASAIGGLSSLAQYVAAMPEGQSEIYYITGDNADSLRSSPHLERARARGWDVLLLTDPIDEWVVGSIGEFEGKALRSVAQGDFKAQDESQAGGDDAKIAALLSVARERLSAKAKDVRASSRLEQSASCLVDADGALSRNMERILRMARQDGAPISTLRVLELNPDHAFVTKANGVAMENPQSAQLGTWIDLLFDMAGLAEGSVQDPAGVVRRIQLILNSVPAA